MEEENIQKNPEEMSADELFEMGQRYYRGKGIRKDYAQALAWYEKAAQKNHPGAIFKMGSMYAMGRGTEADPAKAIEWYEKGSDLNNGLCQFALGQAYYEGTGVEKDVFKAKEYYELSDENGGYNSSEGHLASINRSLGISETTKQIRNKIEWLEHEASLHDFEAAEKLCRIYVQGKFAKPDLQKAEYWYERIEDKTRSEAEYLKGKILQMQGKDEEAFTHFERIQKYHSDARFETVRAYLEGIGTEENLEESLKLMKSRFTGTWESPECKELLKEYEKKIDEALDSGDPEILYKKGLIQEFHREYDDAIKKYRAAANAGNYKAMLRVARLKLPSSLRWAEKLMNSDCSEEIKKEAQEIRDEIIAANKKEEEDRKARFAKAKAEQEKKNREEAEKKKQEETVQKPQPEPTYTYNYNSITEEIVGIIAAVAFFFIANFFYKIGGGRYGEGTIKLTGIKSLLAQILGVVGIPGSLGVSLGMITLSMFDTFGLGQFIGIAGGIFLILVILEDFAMKAVRIIAIALIAICVLRAIKKKMFD